MSSFVGEDCPHREDCLRQYRYHSGKVWKKGYTTGTCAAAAAQGATRLLFTGLEVGMATVRTPKGELLTLPLVRQKVTDNGALCGVVKDSGDDPDITHGAIIMAQARPIPSGIEILGGPGVGVVTRAGLAVAVGRPAINPVPMAMIRQGVEAVLPPGAGVEITISVIGGEELARKTLNSALGIQGGISILGTTGIVEPMSEDAFRFSLIPQIQVAINQGYRTLILTPGKMGALAATGQGFPEATIILTSNFIGFMLEECTRLGVEGIILFGHVGKLAKVAGGVFHTHNRVGDSRAEVVASQAALAGASPNLIARIMDCATAEAMIKLLQEAEYSFLWNKIATRASLRARNHVFGALRVGTMLTDLKGNVVGYDGEAKEMGVNLGWIGPSK